MPENSPNSDQGSLDFAWVLKSEKKNVIDCMLNLSENLAETIKIIHEFSETQNSKWRVWCERSARLRVFKPADRVLLLSTIPAKPLDIRYQGP